MAGNTQPISPIRNPETTISLPNGQVIALEDWIDDRVYPTATIAPARRRRR